MWASTVFVEKTNHASKQQQITSKATKKKSKTKTLLYSLYQTHLQSMERASILIQRLISYSLEVWPVIIRKHFYTIIFANDVVHCKI